MKNVLLATTALVLTAGVAAAEVSFSGYQRFGIVYNDPDDTAESDGYAGAVADQAAAEADLAAVIADPTSTVGEYDAAINALDAADTALAGESAAVAGESDTDLDTRFRLNIDASTETDSGIRFSGRIRMQADDGGSANLNGARFSIDGGGLRVDMGNIAGAIDNLPNYYGYEIGLTDFLGQYAGQGYGFDGYSSTGDGQNGIYARYAMGAFAIAASYSDDDVDDEETAIHVAYSGANFGIALGYADSDVNDNLTVLTGNYDFGTFDIIGFYADSDIDDSSYGVSANVEVGAATSIQVAYGGGDNDEDAYGIGFKHNLGGGAFLRGGVGETGSGTKADLGIRFDF
jgi:outer membrane protein OmpU